MRAINKRIQREIKRNRELLVLYSSIQGGYIWNKTTEKNIENAVAATAKNDIVAMVQYCKELEQNW